MLAPPPRTLGRRGPTLVRQLTRSTRRLSAICASKACPVRCILNASAPRRYAERGRRSTSGGRRPSGPPFRCGVLRARLVLAPALRAAPPRLPRPIGQRDPHESPGVGLADERVVSTRMGSHRGAVETGDSEQHDRSVEQRECHLSLARDCRSIPTPNGPQETGLVPHAGTRTVPVLVVAPPARLRTPVSYGPGACTRAPAT